ncbi:replication endonuclease [Halomonas sp. HG01]|uniref:replication endonuclease n=1 Tax=Halomonas sp. HG01 TaxID=1609967 RepID=UPI00069697F3|nr:replication endonuclease [Halomonas sp. HG01]
MSTHQAAIDRQTLADALLHCGPWKCTDDDQALIDHAEAQADHIDRIRWKAGDSDAYLAAERRVRAHGLNMPDESLVGQLARLCCPMWWRRQLRRLNVRRIEQAERVLGRVHDRAGIYVSQRTYVMRRAQRARNARIMEAETTTNQLGYEYTLAELAEVGLANPENRRAELMLRIADTGREAERLGHVGLFITITCPSRYHAVKRGAARHNRKWVEGDTPTPREAQAYLNRLWDNARNFLGRRGIGSYGLRVVEPHHDGCPHWHVMLWCEPQNVGVVAGVLRRYAVAEDWEEIAPKVDAEGKRAEPEWKSLQRERRRFDVKLIDKRKGTAAGYIAKYVAKNINGHQPRRDMVEGDHLDHYGYELTGSAPRIEAWSSAWGIRQFQFVGLPSVGVWREARRVRTAEELAEWEAQNGTGPLRFVGHPGRLPRSAPLGLVDDDPFAAWVEFASERDAEGWANVLHFVGGAWGTRRPAPRPHITADTLRDTLACARRAGFMRRLHAACDAGRWGEYMRLMGGPMCRRDEQPAKPWKIQRLSLEGVQMGRYGDAVEAPLGIVIDGVECLTRHYLWSSDTPGDKPSQAVKDARAARVAGEAVPRHCGASPRALGTARDVDTGAEIRRALPTTLDGLGRFSPLPLTLNLRAGGAPRTRVINSAQPLGRELFEAVREDRARQKLRQSRRFRGRDYGPMPNIPPCRVVAIRQKTAGDLAVYRGECERRTGDRWHERQRQADNQRRREQLSPILAGWLLDGEMTLDELTPEMIEVLTS